jgi:hypothetical protein
VLLRALSDHASSETLECFLARETLCMETCVKKPETVAKIAAELEALGLIAQRKPPREAPRHAIVYKLLFRSEDIPARVGYRRIVTPDEIKAEKRRLRKRKDSPVTGGNDSPAAGGNGSDVDSPMEREVFTHGRPVFHPCQGDQPLNQENRASSPGSPSEPPDAHAHARTREEPEARRAPGSEAGAHARKGNGLQSIGAAFDDEPWPIPQDPKR